MAPWKWTIQKRIHTIEVRHKNAFSRSLLLFYFTLFSRHSHISTHREKQKVNGVDQEIKCCIYGTRFDAILKKSIEFLASFLLSWRTASRLSLCPYKRIYASDGKCVRPWVCVSAFVCQCPLVRSTLGVKWASICLRGGPSRGGEVSWSSWASGARPPPKNLPGSMLIMLPSARCSGCGLTPVHFQVEPQSRRKTRRSHHRADEQWVVKCRCRWLDDEYNKIIKLF